MTTAVNSCVQQPCHRRVLHSILSVLHLLPIVFFLPPLSRCHLSLGGDSTDVSSMAMSIHITLHFEQHGDPALTTIFCTAVKSFSDEGWNSANL